LFSETGSCEKLKIQFTYHAIVIQIGYLEQWPVLEEESSGTVVEAIKVLQASTLCLPVTSGAQVCGEQHGCMNL